MKKFDKTSGATGKSYGKVGKDRTMDDIEQRRRDRWNFPFIAGMWFQDLFNYDFRRTEQHHSLRHAGRRDQLRRL